MYCTGASYYKEVNAQWADNLKQTNIAKMDKFWNLNTRWLSVSKKFLLKKNLPPCPTHTSALMWVKNVFLNLGWTSLSYWLGCRGRFRPKKCQNMATLNFRYWKSSCRNWLKIWRFDQNTKLSNTIFSTPEKSGFDIFLIVEKGKVKENFDFVLNNKDFFLHRRTGYVLEFEWKSIFCLTNIFSTKKLLKN